MDAATEYTHVNLDVKVDAASVAERVGREGLARAAVTYVGGMTDRFAFATAVGLLGWDMERIPRGIGRGV